MSDNDRLPYPIVRAYTLLEINNSGIDTVPLKTDQTPVSYCQPSPPHDDDHHHHGRRRCSRRLQFSAVDLYPNPTVNTPLWRCFFPSSSFSSSSCQSLCFAPCSVSLVGRICRTHKLSFEREWEEKRRRRLRTFNYGTDELTAPRALIVTCWCKQGDLGVPMNCRCWLAEKWIIETIHLLSFKSF